MSTILLPTAGQRALFEAEVGEIIPRLYAAVRDLYSPLGELARAHIRDTQPPVRGAIVLAAGLGAADTPALRERRILLATALEMLAVALSVHRLLLTGGADDSLDKSLIGSTILTGDFCFSRAAAFAAQTESPTVVDIFAAALKDVSEGHLRRLFDPHAAPFDERDTLTAAGIRAVAHLAALSPAAEATALALAQRVISPVHSSPAEGELNALTLPQRERWQAALEWLASPALPTPSALSS